MTETTNNIPSERLLKNLNGYFYRLSFQNGIVVNYISEQCASILDYTSQQIIECNNSLEDIIHPEDVIKVKKAYALSNNKKQTLEYRIVTLNNQIKWVSDQFISYIKDNTLCIEGYVVEDNSPRMKSKLFHHLRAYRDAIDVNIISSITDLQGRIIYANKNFCAVSKYALHELLGQNHRIIRSGHHPKEIFDQMWAAISTGKLWHGEIMNKAKDGTFYWVDTVIIPIFHEHKKIESYLSLRMLITDKKQNEQQRNNYTMLLEKLAFMVAHKVRKPLCSILGLVDILQNPNNTPEQTEKALQYLKNAASDLNTLTHELSNYLFDNEIQMKVNDFQTKLKNKTT